jgi:cation:H+ antiporter
MSVGLSVSIIVVTSIAIYFAGKYFTQASSHLGERMRLSKAVKGATIDAISSSLPELLVALYSVILFGAFDVGLGTVTGSALFNLLIIPAICLFVSPVVFKVHKEVVHREAIYYILAVIALVIATLVTDTWGLLIPLLFLGVYVAYFMTLRNNTKHHRKNSTRKTFAPNKTRNAILTTIITVIIIAIATYYLTQHAILFAGALGIPQFIVAFVIVAAATSVPDAIISILNARKGSVDDAASNVFGSNIFDLLVGLPVPLIIANILTGPVRIHFEHLELLLGLFVATIITFVMLYKKRTLNKTKAGILLGIYGLFLAYAVFLSV